jgi:hypothetical protein
MGIHISSAAMRLVVDIGIGVELREKLFHGGLADGKGDSLIAIITRKKITRLEEFGGGNLCNFFTVAENAKFGFPGKYFPSTEEACFPAFTA